MIDAEIAANAKAFKDSIQPKISSNIKVIIKANSNALDEAYERLTTLQAWRTYVFESRLSKGTLGFYSEAQNDGLTSLLLVVSGLWRPSLKSLRSLIENMIHCLYYMDHPVEYRQWESGKNRPTFQKLFEYLETHPDVVTLPAALSSCVSDLKKSYSHLSNVVHSSSKELRMTDDINQTNLWKVTTASTGQWATVYKGVLRDLNLLMVLLLKSDLQGAANQQLRKSISVAIPSKKDAAIKLHVNVRVLR